MWLCGVLWVVVSLYVGVVRCVSKLKYILVAALAATGMFFNSLSYLSLLVFSLG